MPGVRCALEITTCDGERVVLRGRGAGGWATAHALVGDLEELEVRRRFVGREGGRTLASGSGRESGRGKGEGGGHGRGLGHGHESGSGREKERREDGCEVAGFASTRVEVLR